MWSVELARVHADRQHAVCRIRCWPEGHVQREWRCLLNGLSKHVTSCLPTRSDKLAKWTPTSWSVRTFRRKLCWNFDAKCCLLYDKNIRHHCLSDVKLAPCLTTSVIYSSLAKLNFDGGHVRNRRTVIKNIISHQLALFTKSIKTDFGHSL